MKTPSTSFERAAGVLLLAALFVGYWSLQRSRRGAHPRDAEAVLRARAEHVSGVVAGGAVRLRGVDVGTVRSVELGKPGDAGGPVHIVLAVAHDVPRWLHADAKALVRAPLVGAATVELVEGSTGVYEEAMTLELSVEPGLADGVARIVDDVHGYEERVRAVLVSLEGAAANAHAITADLRDPTKPIGALVGDARLARRLGDTLVDLRALASELRETGAAVASPSGGVPALVGHAVGAAASVEGVADAMRSETPKMLAGIDRLTGELEQVVRASKGAVQLAPEAVAAAIDVLDDTRRTLEAVQKSILIRGNVSPKDGRSGLLTPRGGVTEHAP